MRKIIFLDVDGVLNSINKLIKVYNETHRPHSGYKYPFDEKCLENLKAMVEETDAYIVITSTWRKDLRGKKRLLEELKDYGLDERVIGYTPIMGRREEEIKFFISKYPEEIEYVVIDDDMLFMDNFVKVETKEGLTEKERDLVIKKFSKKEID